MRGPHVLVVRPDNAGDVLLTGPAVRAVASAAGRVTFWCGPRGRAAAELLPGVDVVVERQVGWIDPEPQPVDRAAIDAWIDRLAALEADQAFVCTSFHQNPLPTALLLRLAGVPQIAAISDDYPGALLDVRHRVDEDLHEVERALSLVARLGYRLPGGDHGRLAVRRPQRGRVPPPVSDRYVVVHPGASVPARAWPVRRHAGLVDGLLTAGWRVVVTGGRDERALTERVARTRRSGVVDLGGQTTWPQLAEVLATADAAVVGNTGPAHLAAAVGTPVVSLFAPTVPASRWRPWGVRHVLLGDQGVSCAGCRAARCPVPGHPCLDRVEPGDVIAALHRLLADKDATLPAQVVG